MAYRITTGCVGCGVCKLICPVGAISGRPQKIQTVDPWLCIDCGACGKVCPHQSVLDQDGRPTKRLRVKKHWPKPVIDAHTCVACRICIEACPTGYLTLSAERGTRQTIRMPVPRKGAACIACGICVDACPLEAIHMQPVAPP